MGGATLVDSSRPAESNFSFRLQIGQLHSTTHWTNAPWKTSQLSLNPYRMSSFATDMVLRTESRNLIRNPERMDKLPPSFTIL